MLELMNASKKGKRLFISLNFFNHPLLSGFLSKSKQCIEGASIKWVEDWNLHLTLQFLGQTGPEQFSEIKTQLDQLSGKLRAPELVISDIGLFTKGSKPKVIFLALEENSDLHELMSLIHEKCGLAGYPLSGIKGQAHITLGRIRRIIEPDQFWDSFNRLKIYFNKIYLEKPEVYSLMVSDLSKGVPEYKALCEYRLVE